MKLRITVDCEDMEEFEYVVNDMKGSAWRSFASEFDQDILRKITRYSEDEIQVKHYQDIRMAFHDLMREHDLSLDD